MAGAEFAAVAAAVSLDLLAQRLRGPAAAAARGGGALAALLIARAAGVSWAELGLSRPGLRRGLRAGAACGATAAAGVCAAAALPATRPFFADERAVMAGGSGLAGALTRITLTAVPPEELSYRSALLGLWLRSGSPARAAGWSSALFGLSHIAPTLATMRHTSLHPRLAGRPRRQAAFVAANVAVTGLGGAVLAGLRLRSGSVLAPLLAHAAVNDAALLAGSAAARGGAGHPAAGGGRAS